MPVCEILEGRAHSGLCQWVACKLAGLSGKRNQNQSTASFSSLSPKCAFSWPRSIKPWEGHENGEWDRGERGKVCLRHWAWGHAVGRVGDLRGEKGWRVKREKTGVREVAECVDCKKLVGGEWKEACPRAHQRWDIADSQFSKRTMRKRPNSTIWKRQLSSNWRQINLTAQIWVRSSFLKTLLKSKHLWLVRGKEERCDVPSSSSCGLGRALLLAASSSLVPLHLLSPPWPTCWNFSPA